MSEVSDTQVAAQTLVPPDETAQCLTMRLAAKTIQYFSPFWNYSVGNNVDVRAIHLGTAITLNKCPDDASRIKALEALFATLDG
jgi:hypothetical protein